MFAQAIHADNASVAVRRFLSTEMVSAVAWLRRAAARIIASPDADLIVMGKRLDVLIARFNTLPMDTFDREDLIEEQVAPLVERITALPAWTARGRRIKAAATV